jgi:hypothetical protein
MNKRFKMYSRCIILILAAVLTACASTYPNRTPVGEIFPAVKGVALSGEEWEIPKGMSGKPTVLLIGYKQNSQFDIDRWLIGLDMTKTQVDVYELPTIQGMFPRMFSTKIDEGMRRGIPKDLWKGVITIYSDGAKVQKFTGNERSNSARVILLDEKGEIKYFHDHGFSVPELNKLKEALAKTGGKS